jgi:hypothetical protein
MRKRTVTFFRSAVNSKGELYKSPLASFEFPSSLSEQEAITRAQEMFAEWASVKLWQERAEFFEVS